MCDESVSESSDVEGVGWCEARQILHATEERRDGGRGREMDEMKTNKGL